MANAGSYAEKMKRDITDAISALATIGIAQSVDDGSVAIESDEGDPRVMPTAKGMLIVPGDQVLVIETPGGPVALCAISTIGVST